MPTTDRSILGRHHSATLPGRLPGAGADALWAAGAGTGLTVLGITGIVVALRPGMATTDVAVLAAYGAVMAVLAGILAGDLVRHRVALRDSTARAIAQALEREERLRLIVASLHEGLIFQDRDLRIVEFNDAASTILGLTEAAIGRRPEELGPWQPLRDDGTALPLADHPAAVTLRTGQPNIDLVLGVATAVRTVWLNVHIVPVFGEAGAVDGVITTFHDITAERSARTALASSEEAVSAAAEALTWQAFHDPLTGLPNRAHLVERLAPALDRARHARELTALLLIDLDRFTKVNDAMGHEAGDDLLAEVAVRLQRTCRPGDVVARLAADEFVVLAEALTSRQDAVLLAERLRAAVAVPLTLEQGSATLTASIGIAFDVDHRSGSLLRDADTAMHKAKEHGRDRVEVFDESLRAETIRKVAAEQVLRQAIDEDGVRVLYQPIIDLTSGAVVGVEALVRIVGPHDELLTPAAFIGIAEETGLIVPIGAAVLEDACHQLTIWRAELGADAPRTVSVNVSARQIATTTFADVVDRTLRRHRLEPGALTLELTETTLIQGGHEAYDAVGDLHELGVGLAIDDFGTGYSSLAYLKRFPVDIVKIDRSFVNGLGMQQHDTEIVRAVLALGQSLGLGTVAEGVETQEQLDLLRELGCDGAQGFFLARPVSSADLAGAIAGIHARLRRSRPSLRLAAD